MTITEVQALFHKMRNCRACQKIGAAVYPCAAHLPAIIALNIEGDR